MHKYIGVSKLSDEETLNAKKDKQLLSKLVNKIEKKALSELEQDFSNVTVDNLSMVIEQKQQEIMDDIKAYLKGNWAWQYQNIYLIISNENIFFASTDII